MSVESPSHVYLQRRQKYKYTTPPWKDVYRKRCLQRLRDGRSRLLDKFRKVAPTENIVKDVMEKEWNLLFEDECMNLSPESKQCNPFSMTTRFDDNEDISDLLRFVEEIQNELIREEQLMLTEQYEESLKFEEEGICAAIESLQQDNVTCPVCKRNPLLQNRQIIFCCCGLRIDTENDAITLDYLRSQLEDVMEQHRNDGCLDEALFSIASYFEISTTNLIMACKSCDFLAVVL